MTRKIVRHIVNEVRQSFAVEECLFSLCPAEGKSLYQQQRYTQKKSEDCAWTPVVDEELLKFLESVEHKAVGYHIRMVMPKLAIELKHLEHQIHILIRNNTSLGLLL